MKKIFSIALIIVFMSTAQAQLFNGSKDLIYTQKAKNHNPGVFSFYTDFNYYSKDSKLIDEISGVKKTYNLMAGNVVFAYGFFNHFDVSLGFRYYQVTNRETDPNVPDDLFLSMRIGSFSFGDNHFYHGFVLGSRFPTAAQYNYPLAEYASGSIEFGVTYAFSFYSNKNLPYRFFNLHANLGYWNHNEKGKVFSFGENLELEADHPSQEFRMALAFAFPTEYVEYRMELTGMLYLQKPHGFIYSAEEYAFLTPSIRIGILSWLSVDLGGDIRLSPEREWTTAEIPPAFPAGSGITSSYPDWKVHFGINIKYNFKENRGGEGFTRYQKSARQKVEMEQTLIDEIENTKKRQKEVEELKKLRKETEEEIQNLKRVFGE
ncbi:MAG: hypothetical protein JXR46_09170 [Calditrichaceae bacterium]|nr:hypothetical protein [Calditrichaceae bacterium]MBN2709203.1 hypothetical protein [Calditrichaceae bacterium]RQV96158.1 MAG: hypothetical protein EH224_05480 [Calditrichota bacterium]